MTTAKIDTAKSEKKTEQAAPKAAKSVENEVFAMNKMEVPAFIQEMTEKSVDQAREGYAKVKSASEEASAMLEETMEVTRDSFMEINLKAVDAAKDNSEAAFSHIRDMFGVKSLSEAIELQSSYSRKQYDAMSQQVREMQETATKLATTMSQPAKEAFDKSMKDMKLA
ncbi:Phasin protein [Pseudovibrio sp. W64]|uniref:phasin n=1 Tax=unclassified Pseudovibrio TaxID=2627060 RepID=UPI000708A153|nr:MULTISPECIES: phasin [unclassified Pseudovibrio]KZK79150.1 Phasin protein [Pseudovibrio sp. W64]KZK86171.1 Phasin protein [Pseudovibrio sp. Ad13]KZK92383.1 Phasin protein [Pseudovibrio sp. W74]KZK94007.1 Phasin protein [Pseudovibrio sp. Ad46]KZL02000.1 Phasin protein [Pseudovibrio sp. Ad5]